MDNTITFYTHPMSRGRIARWMLEELGVDYSTEIVEYGPPMKSEDYLAINPMGKIPALTCGNEVVTEVAAICAFLADRFPEKGLLAEPGNRGSYYRWLFFGAGPIEHAVTNHALGFEVPKEKQPMIGYGKLERVLNTLEAKLNADEFIAGNQFSAADVYVGSHLIWGLQFKTVDERPAFVDYISRLKERPAYQRAKEIDDRLMPKKDN
ncbi:MAG: glutathione S-transferase family protein [Gammaproteobacteria bacterium]|nr:glutathione S-transferase family protein [Gammaproteobacteria bacterium]MYF54012.1 glutathione S-transferase family protein [Gammaproteobacteria bacterium]MYK43929.1 glutathione S-transferase family protein [Gammaproteobacteria bacterium]